MIKKLAHGSAIGIAAAVVALVLSSTNSLDWFEHATWDWRVKKCARPAPSSDRIRLLVIDQTTLDWADEEWNLSWKWPRSVYAGILSFCRRGGAKGILLDLTFTEPSDYPDRDRALGSAIAETPGVASALFLSRKQGLATNWPSYVPSLPVPGLSDYLADHAPPDLMMTRASFPIPEVVTNGATPGNVYLDPDAGAIIRRAFMFQIFDRKFVPSMGLAALLAARPNAELKFVDDVFYVDGTRIPLDDRGMAILNYRGKLDAYQGVNLAAVMLSEARIREGKEPSVDPSFVKDAFVVVGGTAPGLMDVKSTPVAKIYPGLGVHATVLDNLLGGDFMRETSLPCTAAIVVVAALVAGIAGRMSTAGWHVVLAFALLLPLPFLAGLAAYRHGYWLQVAVQVVAVALALVGAVIVNYAVEGRQKRFIKSAFKQYLSPAQVDRLVRDPDSLKLGGETRELSILFSDVQGFTSISESLTPQDLTALLNKYLTVMTNIILDEGGTIDKYEGDAIIAFWNAPLDLPGHAKCAVRAALRCNRALAEMRPELKEMTARDIFARIGINTGSVVVGNMGSNQRFDYTFLGDAGNLASRLEGINKQFGTFVMISQYTLAQIEDEFPVRELSRVRVVGRAEPVTVFEPMFPDDFEKRRDAIKTFTTGLYAYYDGEFRKAGKAFSEIADSDPTAAIYARRCRDLQESHPAPWDGVWAMTEK